MQESILPEFESFVESGNEYKHSANGIGSAAENTQMLLTDVENINRLMDDNQLIVMELSKETEIFVEL